MANRFDVAARLSEGQPAVQRTQTYVQACHVLGYQHPDLTAHGSQVRDWYETEAGLDLRLLDDDSAELRAVVNTIDEALWLQQMQVTEIAAAWMGVGADSATEFLKRHCDNATEVAGHIRASGEAYAGLRDQLWQLVDRKVATAADIDDRSAGERSAWLAAAHTVTAAGNDRSAAEQLVRHRIIPYVDNDIRDDWLTAMRSTAASVQASYDAAIDALSSVREVSFAIPGELGPRWQPALDEPFAPSPATATVSEMPTPSDIAPTVPAAVSAPAPAPPAPPAPAAQIPPDPAAPMGDTGGLSTGTGNLGNLGGLAGGIGGVVGSIVDGIGGLLGSLAAGFSKPSGLDDPLLDDASDVDEPLGDDTDDHTDDETADPEPTNAEPADADTSDEELTTEAPAQNPSAASDSVDEPVAQQVPPPAVPPPSAPEPRPDGATPCEIAEDELPQAGQ